MLNDGAAEAFYARAIGMLDAAGIPFLIGGTFAVSAYTGISRTTKDLDIFCRAADRQRVLVHFQDAGYRVELVDDRWLGKVFDGDNFFDVIHGASNGGGTVSDDWFAHARRMEVLGRSAQVIAPTELVWSKMFIQLRHRYDGADVAHVILRAHDQINWQRLLSYMDVHWEVLLVHLLNFRWIYPARRDLVPEWLLSELIRRLGEQRQLPPPGADVCRGRMLSAPDYEIDIREWGFIDIGGSAEGAERAGEKDRAK
ncbi:MAG TPA: hypothetical protein VFJ18_12325 [Pararhizobium sp.]|nr:hypothetical protein [Pararhizobium sp.]